MSMPSLAATADHGKLGHNNYWLTCCDVYALVGCNHKNYLLAGNVYALVAATANGELENKHYLLAYDVYALVGCNC